jgi:hypothetical protein
MEFVCGQDQDVLPCHRFIIGAQSKFLRTLMLSAVSEGRCQIFLPDIKKEHMTIVLQFLYTGKLKLASEIIPALRELLVKVLRIDANFKLPGDENDSIVANGNSNRDGEGGNDQNGSPPSPPSFPSSQPPPPSDGGHGPPKKRYRVDTSGQRSTSSAVEDSLPVIPAPPMTPPHVLDDSMSDDEINEIRVITPPLKTPPPLVDLSDDEADAATDAREQYSYNEFTNRLTPPPQSPPCPPPSSGASNVDSKRLQFLDAVEPLIYDDTIVAPPAPKVIAKKTDAALRRWPAKRSSPSLEEPEVSSFERKRLQFLDPVVPLIYDDTIVAPPAPRVIAKKTDAALPRWPAQTSSPSLEEPAVSSFESKRLQFLDPVEPLIYDDTIVAPPAPRVIAKKTDAALPRWPAKTSSPSLEEAEVSSFASKRLQFLDPVEPLIYDDTIVAPPAPRVIAKKTDAALPRWPAKRSSPSLEAPEVSFESESIISPKAPRIIAKKTGVDKDRPEGEKIYPAPRCVAKSTGAPFRDVSKKWAQQKRDRQHKQHPRPEEIYLASPSIDQETVVVPTTDGPDFRFHLHAKSHESAVTSNLPTAPESSRTTRSSTGTIRRNFFCEMSSSDDEGSETNDDDYEPLWSPDPYAERVVFEPDVLPPPLPEPPEAGLVIHHGKWVTFARKMKLTEQNNRKRQTDNFRIRPYKRYEASITGRKLQGTDQDMAEPDGVHECHQCPAKFAKTKSLRVHISREHNPNARTPCPECGKRLTGPGALPKHLLSHRPESEWPFQCEYCGKKFQARGDLPKHYQTRQHLNDPRIPKPGTPEWGEVLKRSEVLPLNRFPGLKSKRNFTSTHTLTNGTYDDEFIVSHIEPATTSPVTTPSPLGLNDINDVQCSSIMSVDFMTANDSVHANINDVHRSSIMSADVITANDAVQADINVVHRSSIMSADVITANDAVQAANALAGISSPNNLESTTGTEKEYKPDDDDSSSDDDELPDLEDDDDNDPKA